MDANQLLELVQRHEENRAYITNEETAKMALVVPFIRLLGYDPNVPREVRLEFAADFTQGDGKKLPDRMDFAIFDKTGTKALMVIETKPLGTDLAGRAQQLARYIAQMPDLHFGIITDGCHFLLYGDLDSPNQMDHEPFFRFSLDDPKTDWAKVAAFLTKFSRDAFNAETLVTDAENSRYRQAMVEKLSKTLRNPAEDEGFMNWLTKDVYTGKRTGAVKTRLGEIARDAIEPALLRVIGDEFVEKLKERIQRSRDATGEGPSSPATTSEFPSLAEERPSGKTETTAEEIEFFDIIRDICVKNDVPSEDILPRDTVNYFNVSFRRPTKWFVRFFGSTKRKYITTWVPTDEARSLAPGFEVEDAPPVFGVSRIYLENVAQLRALKSVILRSLELVRAKKEEPIEDPSSNL